MLEEAGERVASGWGFPVRHAVRIGTDGTVLSLIWQSEGQVRGVLTRALPNGAVEIFGASPVALVPGTTQVPLTARRRLTRFDAPPTADELTLALRLAMEEVARWQPAAA